MNEDHDKNEFRLDPQAKSFRLTGYSWRDLPWLICGLALVMALLTGVNYVTALSLSFLNRESQLLVCGTLMGFGAGVWVGRFLIPVRSAPDCEKNSSKTILTTDTNA